MKNKTLKIIIALILFFVVNIGLVNAEINITFSGQSGDVGFSDGCRKPICAQVVSASGIRVSLVDKNDVQITGTKIINLWSTSATKKFVSGEANFVDDSGQNNGYNNYYSVDIILKGEGLQNNIYDSSLGLKQNLLIYSGINEFSQETVAKIISYLTVENEEYVNLSSYKDFYLKMEPVYIIKEKYYSNYNFFAGTTREIFNLTSSYTARYNYYACNVGMPERTIIEHFIHGGPTTCKGGQWNEIRNYVVALYDTTFKNYGNAAYNVNKISSAKSPNLSTLFDDYKKNTSGLGIGYMKISEFLPSELVENPKLTIKKINSSNKKLITSESPTIYLHEGADCQGTGELLNFTSGQVKIDDIAPGTYSLKETKAPTGYEEPVDQCVNKSIVINSGDDLIITIENIPTCETKRNAAISDGNYDAKEAFQLYKEYGLNQLLNLDEPKCYNESYVRSDGLGCLEFFSGRDGFGERRYKDNNGEYKSSYNLSNYDYALIDNYDNYVGFCEYSADFFRNSPVIKDTNFYTTAGKPLISSNLVMGMSDSRLTCFLIDGDYSISYSNLPINAYFGDNDRNGEADLLTPYTENYSYHSHTPNEKSLYEVVYGTTYYWYFSKFYVEAITGDVNNVKKNNSIVFQGILSPFNPEEIEEPDDISEKITGSLPFKIIYNNKTYLSENCYYEVEKEIIKDELELEFRTIDTTNPFPGKNGNNRETNKNWCGEDGCGPENKTVQTYIKEANNSYNSKTQNPIYRIELNASDIMMIRDYNKSVPYDDYNYRKINGSNTVVNNFLDSLSQGSLRKYDESGNVIKNYGTISRLEKNAPGTPLEINTDKNEGMVMFRIINTNGKIINNTGAKITIYDGSDCVENPRIVNLNGRTYSAIYEYGDYSVKEIDPPWGYEANNECKSFKVEGDLTTVNIKNSLEPGRVEPEPVPEQPETEPVPVQPETEPTIESLSYYTLDINLGKLIFESKPKKMSSCYIEVSGSKTNGELENGNTKCKIDLESLVPIPPVNLNPFLPKPINREFHVFKVSLNSGETYSTCIRFVAYRELMVPVREQTIADMSCCTNQASCE